MQAAARGQAARLGKKSPQSCFLHFQQVQENSGARGGCPRTPDWWSLEVMPENRICVEHYQRQNEKALMMGEARHCPDTTNLLTPWL